MIRRMKAATQRGHATLYPMPVRLDCPATLRVSDDAGRLVRREELPAGTNLTERPRSAHDTYAVRDGPCRRCAQVRGALQPSGRRGGSTLPSARASS